MWWSSPIHCLVLKLSTKVLKTESLIFIPPCLILRSTASSSNVGGSENYRIFEYLDLDILKENPKVISDYSDTTSVHHMFQLTSVVSFYGQCLLVDFAGTGNGGMYDFTRKTFEQVLMFGHTEPKWTTLPLGIKAMLNLNKQELTLLETATC